MSEQDHKRRPRFRWAAFFIVLGALGFAVYQTLTHPGSPLPDEWNPVAGFSIEDPVSPLTTWKLRRVLNDPVQCLAVLDAANIGFDAMDPFEATQDCHIRNRVQLSQIRSARIDPIETSCAIAVRMAFGTDTVFNQLPLRSSVRRRVLTAKSEAITAAQSGLATVQAPVGAPIQPPTQST